MRRNYFQITTALCHLTAVYKSIVNVAISTYIHNTNLMNI